MSNETTPTDANFSLSHSNGIHIPHLSASTINSFINDRFGFWQSKVAREPFKGSVHTARGKAVEHGVNTWIEKPGCTDLLAEAHKVFDEEIKLAGISKFDAEDIRESVKGLLDEALKFYQPEFTERKAVTQRKISVRLDGVKREIIGYLDYFQPSVAVRDSKVVSRTPSSLSQPYILQGALYRYAEKLPVVFDFFVDNKKPVHKPITLSDDEYLFGLSYLTRAAQVIEELEECDNPKRVMELMSFPNLDNLWTHSDRVAACKTWGILMK